MWSLTLPLCAPCLQVFMLLLQMYWASVVLKQVVKIIVGKEDDALASILFAVLLLLIGLAKALPTSATYAVSRGRRREGQGIREFW